MAEEEASLPRVSVRAFFFWLGWPCLVVRLSLVLVFGLGRSEFTLTAGLFVGWLVAVDTWLSCAVYGVLCCVLFVYCFVLA